MDEHDVLSEILLRLTLDDISIVKITSKKLLEIVGNGRESRKR